MRRLLATIVALACTVTIGASPRRDIDESGAVPRGALPVLVELFTSEGCSSCPPADRILSELVQMQRLDGAQIVAMSEHVDYWNQLGWKDPFSDALFSRRQQTYAERIAGTEVYTPQVIIDGGFAVLVGSDRLALKNAIKAATAVPKKEVILRWTGDDRTAVEIIVPADRRTKESPVMLAITEDGLRTRVSRGENQGRDLEHDAVTRKLFEAGRTDADGAFQKVVPISFDVSWRKPRLRVITFVQTKTGVVGTAMISH